MREILQAQKIYGEYLLKYHPFIHSTVPLIKQRNINKNIASLPTEFDSRKQWPGKINKNGDQFGSGCCYLFGCLYAFSDRYAIFKNQDYIRMSVVEIAAVERAFTPNGDKSIDTDKERSGKKGCINCDPMQNGDGSQILNGINVYGTVSEVGKENDPNFSFAKFCKNYSNCACPPKSPDSYCNDDSWKNYQTDLSKKLPSDIGIYSNVQKYPTEEEKKNMIINNISPDNYDFTSLATEIMTNGPVGITYFFGPDFTRDNYNETNNIYMCTNWEDDSNPFGYKASGKSGSGGHYISIIGFGSQQVSYKYKGRQENQLIHYYLCRNSWGENNHSFFKAAAAQKISGVLIMQGVWGICSFVTFISTPTYKCVNGLCIPCEKGESGCSEKSVCDQSCVIATTTYKCNGQNCVKCNTENLCQYIDSNCKGECKPPPVIKGSRCNFTTGKCEECVMGQDTNCGVCNFCEKMYSGNTCTPCTYSSVGCFPNKNCEKRKNKMWIIIAILIIMIVAIFIGYKIFKGKNN